MTFIIRGGFAFLITLVPFIAQTAPTKVGKYIIPDIFSQSLEQGMTVPVFIRSDTTKEKSQQKIADAIISLIDGSIIVKSLVINELPNNATLSKSTRNLVEKIRDIKFDKNATIELSNNISLELDIKSFHIEMVVGKDALTESVVSRSSLLGPSSIENISNVTNYSFGTFYNNYRTGSSARSYLTYDNSISLRENHININGSYYGIGDSNSTNKLYRVMYERDYEGYRLALGMLDTWNMQSIASLNAINGGKIYGVSYGNKGNTIIEKNALSLIPITVFLPTEGEVHILRDGRLLSVQNFNMGSYEIDTSRFPYGVYDVNVETVINGKIINSRISRVNKLFSNQHPPGVEGLYWQIFSGSLKYEKVNYKRHDYQDLGNEKTWISGGAASISLSSGVELKGTFYGFDKNIINETDATININEYVSLGNQTLIANDSSWRNISNLNVNIPHGFGSIWTSREDSKIGDKIPLQERDNYSIGATINLANFIPSGGALTVSQTESRYSGNKYRNLDYSTTLYSNRYATIGLRAGIQRYYYNNNNNDGSQERYISLDFSLPLASWLSMGVSKDRYGSTQGNVNARKQFSDGAVRSVGLSASTRISGEQHYENNYSVNGNLNYATKYNSGTASVTHAADNSTNMNFSSQGSLAMSGTNIGLAQERQQAGVIVNTNLDGDEKLAAKINNRNYILSGTSNFIALPPYAQYKMEIMNDKSSEDSFDIVTGRLQEITLYPGNVGVISPKIKNMVTVFGRIRYSDGQLASNADIHNHIGKTRTDSKGEFAIDIDKKYPVITLMSSNGTTCEADLDLENSRGAAWVGEIQCSRQTLTVKR